MCMITLTPLAGPTHQAKPDKAKGKHPWVGTVKASGNRVHLACRKDRHPLLNMYENGKHVLCAKIDSCKAGCRYNTCREGWEGWSALGCGCMCVCVQLGLLCSMEN